MTSGETPSARRRVSRRRWASLVLCGLTVAVVQVCLYPLSQRWATAAWDALGDLPTGSAAVLLALSCVAVSYRTGSGRWSGFFGLRHFWRYPPLWVAVVVALSGIGAAACQPLNAMTGLPAVLGALVWTVSLIPLAGGASLVRAGSRSAHRHGGRRSARRIDAAEGGPDDFETLQAWLTDDDEIEHPSQDRFGHDEIAQRIARRIASTRDEAPTIAVVGPQGAGKTSIRRLVAHHLETELEVRLVEVSLWPFDTPEAAASGILAALVKELGRHVNVLPLVGLSDDYVEAIERADGRLGSLTALLQRADPADILDRLSTIVLATGMRLVLWVEDLERFAGVERLSADEAAARDAERLGAIRALLHLLDRSPGISVIIADTSLETRFDVGKIARFVERPSRPEAQQVWTSIRLLRRHCLGGFPRAIIDPASAKRRAELQPPEDPDRMAMWLWDYVEDRPTAQRALVDVVDTPRAFKTALRQVLEVWQDLAGEIDFDDVLVASVLRTARPEVFTLLDDNVELFRSGFNTSVVRKREPGAHPVIERLEQLLEKEPTQQHRDSVKALISFLFSGYPPKGERPEADFVAAPQAVTVNRHVDYWKRYVTQASPTATASDQSALRMIAAWRENGKNDLVERLLAPASAEQVTSFVGQFTREGLCRLLREVVAVSRESDPRKWDGGIRAPGLRGVWWMMQRRPPKSDSLLALLKDLEREVVPVHLPLAWDLYMTFASAGTERTQSLLDEAERLELLGDLQKHFVNAFARSEVGVMAFLEALKSGAPHLTWWICGGPNWLRQGSAGQPLPEWPKVASLLVRAAEKDPSAAIPQLLPFVCESSGKVEFEHLDDEEPESLTPARKWAGKFDRQAARKLFDFAELMRVLLQPIPVPEDPSLAAALRAAQAEAREFRQGGDHEPEVFIEG